MLPASVDATSWLARAMQIVFTLVLIPLFRCCYFRQLPDDRRAKLRSILTLVALAQVLLYAGLAVLHMRVSAPATPGDPMLTLCVTVILACGRLLMSARSQNQ
jgi:hypothetical protein